MNISKNERIHNKYCTHTFKWIWVKRNDCINTIQILCGTFIHFTKNNKHESSLGYHCDILYDSNGHYYTNPNARIRNTSTIIFVFCDGRILMWRRKVLYTTKCGTRVWVTDKVWNNSIIMHDCSITVISNIDEYPCYVSRLGTELNSNVEQKR